MSRIYETAIAIGATITKSFGSDVKNASESLKKLAEATKQLKAAEKSATAFKKLDAEVGRAKTRLDTATAAMRKLDAAERAAGGATAESTRWRAAGNREVAAASRQFDRATKAADKNATALRAMGVDTSKLTSEQQRLARALEATERQEKSLERFSAARERLFGKKREREPLFGKAKEQLRGLGESFLHLVEVGAVAGETLHLLVEKTIHAGSNIGETAEKLGIGARALQELRYGAQQSGAEVEDLDRALAKMAMNIGKTRLTKKSGGGGGLLSIPGLSMFGASKGKATSFESDPFRQIGLNAKNLSTLKPEEQLKKIADGLNTLKTHAEKAAVAQAIFGKGATSILPYLAEGSEGIDKLSKAANKYGGVLSDETVRASIEAEKASKDMNLALNGLASTLGSVLLPIAVDAFKGISKWVGENRGAIKKWAEEAARWIEQKGIPAFKHIVADIQSFGAKVLWLVEGASKLTGGFGNLLIVMGALRVAPVAITIGKIGLEASKAAIALFKYVEATKAAQAANAAPSAGGGGAGGVGLGGLFVLGAAAYGMAKEHNAMVDRLKSDKARIDFLIREGLSKEDAIARTEQETGHALGWHLRVPKLSEGEKARLFARLPSEAGSAPATLSPATPKTASAGVVAVNSETHFHGDSNRKHVEHGLKKAHEKALSEYDQREAKRRRVSYAE